MGLRWDTFKAFLRTVVADGQTLRRSGQGFTSVAVSATSESNTFTAGQAITPTAATSGSRSILALTGAADTGITASTEQVDLSVNGARTVTFATGALTNQRMVSVRAQTIAFVGASTLTNAATVYIDGAATAGTNATITNNYALWVDAGRVRLDGALALLSVPSLYADTQTGASPTVSRPAGVVRVASGDTAVTVTNTLVSATSHVYATIRNATSNGVTVMRVVPGSGSFTITLSGDPGASHADISFFVVDPNAGV